MSVTLPRRRAVARPVQPTRRPREPLSVAAPQSSLTVMVTSMLPRVALE